MWQAGLVVAVAAAVWLLRYYMEKGTRLYVMIPVVISWSLGFAFFLVLPFDLEYAFCRKCRADGKIPEGDCACLMPQGMGIEVLLTGIPIAYTCAAPSLRPTACGGAHAHAASHGRAG